MILDKDDIDMPFESKLRRARRERQWLMYADSYSRIRKPQNEGKLQHTLSVIFLVMSLSVRFNVLKALPK